MGCDIASSMLQRLPIVVLSQIASYLNLSDQKNFGDTCKAARMVNGSIDLNNFFYSNVSCKINKLLLLVVLKEEINFMKKKLYLINFFIIIRNYTKLYFIKKEIILNFFF